MLIKQIRPCFGTKFDLIKSDDWNTSIRCLQHLSVNVDVDSAQSSNGNINLATITVRALSIVQAAGLSLYFDYKLPILSRVCGQRDVDMDWN